MVKIRFRLRFIWLLITVLLIIEIGIFYKWKWFCTNFDSKGHVSKMCNMYQNGVADGTLCAPMCKPEELGSVSCQTYHTSKEIVFNAFLSNKHLIFKSAASSIPTLHWYDNGVLKYPTEKEFLSTIKAVTKNMLNYSLSSDIINSLAHLRSSSEVLTEKERQVEMDNIWILIQDNEYLLSNAYKDRGCFPQMLGTCGVYFAVEYVQPIPELHSMLFDTDTKENWNVNVKYSISIMELLEELENNFHEPFYMCDIKLQDLGITDIENGRVKVLDLDNVYPKSIINKFIFNIEKCDRDEDCKFFDCRSRCNKKLNKCDSSVSNNNLQIVCEKLFLGWKIPNTLLVPGLLLSQYAPVELMIVLRQCANPDNEVGIPKASAGDDIRKRLYSILLDIDYIF